MNRIIAIARSDAAGIVTQINIVIAISGCESVKTCTGLQIYTSLGRVYRIDNKVDIARRADIIRSSAEIDSIQTGNCRAGIYQYVVEAAAESENVIAGAYENGIVAISQ
jgi:hypothetical protein